MPTDCLPSSGHGLAQPAPVALARDPRAFPVTFSERSPSSAAVSTARRCGRPPGAWPRDAAARRGAWPGDAAARTGAWPGDAAARTAAVPSSDIDITRTTLRLWSSSVTSDRAAASPRTDDTNRPVLAVLADLEAIWGR